MTPDRLPGETLPELRRTLYRMLASLLLEPGDGRLSDAVAAVEELRARVELLRELASFPAWEGVLGALEELSDEEVEAIREEHAALFVAGVRSHSCPPHESAYGPGGASEAGAIIAEVAAAYAAAGLVTHGNREPDHLAVELEFLSYLCEQESVANDGAASAAWRERQRSFLDGHLLRWLGPFARDVRAAAPRGFYVSVAETALRFAEHDRLVLDAVPDPGD